MEMRFDSFDTDREAFSDSAVCQAIDDEEQDFMLAAGERQERRSEGKTSNNHCTLAWFALDLPTPSSLSNTLPHIAQTEMGTLLPPSFMVFSTIFSPLFF